MNAERLGFCSSLKDARLRRDLTLQSIADSTKIGAALLADLERGDFSRWPKGLFRRAFLREYAAAIGLSPEHVVGEVRRLFPEDGSVPPAGPALPPSADGLRLMLAPDERWWLRPTARRAVAASLDVLVVLVAGAAISYLVSGNAPLITAVVGLTYYFAATLCAGATPASLLLHRRSLLGPRAVSGSLRAVERPRLVFSGPGPLSTPVDDDHHESLATRESLRPTSQAARG